MGKQYEIYVQKGTPLWKVVTNVLFSHVGLLVLVIGYCILGAQVFIYLEKEREDEEEVAKQDSTRAVDEAVRYLKSAFWAYGTNEAKYNYTREQFKAAVLEDMHALKRFVLTENSETGYDATDGFDRAFTLPSSILFTITIMTTVGYGHISPKTKEGKLFCILYSLIGIPLLLIFMGKTKGISFDEVGKERYMPTDLVMIPIMVNLMLIFTFIFVGALLFASWEDWSATEAAYFCFVTLTTIGFGDYWPQQTTNGYNKDVLGALKMCFTVAYCIFGMTLISMCMNLMQEQIVEKVNWIAEELGMKGDGSDDEVVKLSREGKVPITDPDKDGNKNDFGGKKKKKKKKEDEKVAA